MKTLAARITMIIMLIAMASGLVYANTGITEADIKAGLEACKAYPVSLRLDENTINFAEKDVPPVIVKERTLIPARALFEGMGGKVTWNNDTQSVFVTYDNTEVVLTIGSKTALVNGVAKELEVPAMIIDHDGDYYGSTMIPVRFTAEALGCKVGWEDPTRSVVVESPSNDSNSGNSNGNNDSNTGDNDNNSNNGNDNSGNNSNNNGNNDSNNNGNNDSSNNGNSDLIWQFEALNEAAKDKLVVI
ncbi:MAG: copper amine oxidase N-terminal domain-containing protein, partial [Aminipila sp.]